MSNTLKLPTAQAIHTDSDAVAIGELYRKGRAAVLDSVRFMIEAGERLSEKKKSLPHGHWLPWLAANADVLGFETDRTAQMLMKAARKAESNPKLASDLDADAAIQISREVWGHNDPVRGIGETKAKPPKNNRRAAIFREMKLGKDTVAKIKGTSLDNAREQDELIMLNRGAPQGGLTPMVAQLVNEAAAGKAVSAIATGNPVKNPIASAWEKGDAEQRRAFVNRYAVDLKRMVLS